MMPDDVIEVRADGEVLAKCALWWSSTPQLDGCRVGYIGHYERSDKRAAQTLLRLVRKRLTLAGCGIAVGPVDGSTWHRSRFVTERGDRPPFLLEPDNPDSYPEDFRTAGFTSLAHYVSAEEVSLDHSDPRADRAKERLLQSGVCIRPLDLGRFEEELASVYEVACASFADALLFSPISRQAFRAGYEPLRPSLDSEFIRVAHHGDRVVGFAFGIPDFKALERGHQVDTIVAKTWAVLPDPRYRGLGAVMLNDVRCAAHRRGMRRIIHALIREGNVSLNLSRRSAMPMRGYTLFAGKIA
jgi:GNAT superfamily N-acetyltransferase